MRRFYMSQSGLYVPVPLSGIQTVAFGHSGGNGVGAQHTLAGWDFEPNCGLIMTTARASAAVDGLSLNYGIGLWASMSDRRCVVAYTADAADPTQEHFSHREDAVGQFLSNSTTSAGLLDVHSTQSDGMKFVNDEAFPGNITWLHTGFRATQAETGSFLEGDTNIGVSFTPDIIFIIGTPTAQTPPVIETAVSSAISWGYAHGIGAANQWCQAMGSQDNVGTTVCARYHSLGGHCAALLAANMASANLLAITDMSGGVSCSWSAGTTGRYLHYLAIKGGQWFTKEVITPTVSGTPFAITGCPFTPLWAMPMMVRNASGVDAAFTADGHFDIGQSSENVVGISTACMLAANDHGATSGNPSRAYSTAFIQGLTLTQGTNGGVDIVSWAADGLNVQLSQASSPHRVTTLFAR